MASVILTVADNQEIPKLLISDYISSVTGNRGEQLAVLVIEVNAQNRNQRSDDFCKLAKEMKRMTDVLATYGITNTTVCGLLVDGNINAER